jgi:hypothetical protein
MHWKDIIITNRWNHLYQATQLICAAQILHIRRHALGLFTLPQVRVSLLKWVFEILTIS